MIGIKEPACYVLQPGWIDSFDIAMTVSAMCFTFDLYQYSGASNVAKT